MGCLQRVYNVNQRIKANAIKYKDVIKVWFHHLTMEILPLTNDLKLSKNKSFDFFSILPIFLLVEDSSFRAIGLKHSRKERDHRLGC